MLGNLLLIAAVIAATGTHWFVLQSMAWTGMLARNLQNSSVSQAVERTFDGAHPCSLCKQISKGKQTEKKREFQPTCKKLEFSYLAHAMVFTPPAFFWETVPLNASGNSVPLPPPVPPPRPLLG
jgi:hypothetical protein